MDGAFSGYMAEKLPWQPALASFRLHVAVNRQAVAGPPPM